MPFPKELSIPVPQYVITLVHGTWSHSSIWKDSELYRILKDELQPAIIDDEFNWWKGPNHHADRIQAGRQLATRLEDHWKVYPKAKHVVVGHSHGGNVALYAVKHLNEKGTPDLLEKIVCLATPHLHVRARPIDQSLNVLKWVASIATFLLSFGLLLLSMITFPPLKHIILDEPELFLLLGLLPGVLVSCFPASKVYDWIDGPVRKHVGLKAKFFNDQLSTPPVHTPIFSGIIKWDEPKQILGFWNTVATSIIFLWHRVTDFALLIGPNLVTLWVMAFMVIVMIAPMIGFDKDLLRDSLIDYGVKSVFFYGMGGLILVFLIMVVIDILAKWPFKKSPLPFFREKWWGFGQINNKQGCESLLDNLLVNLLLNVHSEETGPQYGKNTTFKKFTVKREIPKELIHSRIYNDESIAKHVAQWIADSQSIPGDAIRVSPLREWGRYLQERLREFEVTTRQNWTTFEARLRAIRTAGPGKPDKPRWLRALPFVISTGIGGLFLSLWQSPVVLDEFCVGAKTVGVMTLLLTVICVFVCTLIQWGKGGSVSKESLWQTVKFGCKNALIMGFGWAFIVSGLLGWIIPGLFHYSLELNTRTWPIAGLLLGILIGYWGDHIAHNK